ncbi:polyamine ABC transporter substrate-binding protein [Neotabrizicola shimadae]|uniref:Putrescine-binding periplasmic protein n=1 Tax=Neotabrizicola shimadae TaxID=2807096 RepID=A0A8G1ED96_9RHOB|nr:polyamine ABC transporter substrate-binding protein [Neotabrizicola shimadae]QYZ71440.1 polyamine ABC transporter substrate-binding protein [Neotabrizicola shimadae]
MKLSRRTALVTLGSALAMPWVRPSWAQSGSVNVYNWADYIGETTLDDFTAATGIGVNYDLYGSAEEMQAKMLAGSTGYDVVVMAGQSMPQFNKAGIYQVLDRSKLPNWKNLDPEIMKIVEGYDPGNEHSVPYMWGSVGFTFNLDMVKERLPDADLSDLGTIFNPENAAKLADCGISILDSPTDIGYAVMSWLGIDPNKAGPAEYARLIEAFKPIREYITTFDNGNYLNTIPNGELCVANTWSGDYAVAKARAAEAGIEMNLAYHVPKTGAPAWFDLLAIPADAPSTDNAYKFIDFMMQPEVIAAATNFTGYANANAAAKPFVDPAILNDPAIYPDHDTLSRMYTPLPMTDEQERDLTRAWAEIKAG